LNLYALVEARSPPAVGDGVSIVTCRQMSTGDALNPAI